MTDPVNPTLPGVPKTDFALDDNLPPFPWPAMRDFIDTVASLKLAQQNLMVGKLMKAPEEQIVQVEAAVTMLSEQAQANNARVETGLRLWKEGKPRLMIAH